MSAVIDQLSADVIRRSFDAGVREAIDGKRKAEAQAKYYSDLLAQERMEKAFMHRELIALRLACIIGAPALVALCAVVFGG